MRISDLKDAFLTGRKDAFGDILALKLVCTFGFCRSQVFFSLVRLQRVVLRPGTTAADKKVKCKSIRVGQKSNVSAFFKIWSMLEYINVFIIEFVFKSAILCPATTSASVWLRRTENFGRP